MDIEFETINIIPIRAPLLCKCGKPEIEHWRVTKEDETGQTIERFECKELWPDLAN